MYNSRGQESTPIAHGKLPTFFLNFSKKKQQTFSVCERAYVTQASIWGANSRGGGDNRSSRKNINTSGWVGSTMSPPPAVGGDDDEMADSE
jgi:hypothetical protein